MSDPASLQSTPLEPLHQQLDARFAPFGGYRLPLHFEAGILKEHLHTRRCASLFDVSHMGQIRLLGPAVAEALEALIPADLVGLEPGRQRYGLLTNDGGGIIDDLMITRYADEWRLVVNASRKAVDLTYLRSALPAAVALEHLEESALLALQGPSATAVLSDIAPAVAKLHFLHAAVVEIDGVACHLTRSGYTGEDGFEISLPAKHAPALAQRLLSYADVAPAGLGARDSLRLEAGLCLYGNDIDEQTTPVEAALVWSLGKARRPGGKRAGGFPGAAAIFEQLQQGAVRRRVGLRSTSRTPVRAHCSLQNEGGQTIGEVTSGGFGPSVGAPIAMGYVATEHTAVATPLTALVRHKPQPVVVAPLPFIQPNYYRG